MVGRELFGCDFCDNDVAFKRRYRGLQLFEVEQCFCEQCFSNLIEERVLANIYRHNMIQDNDSLLLCISGEKDSMVLWNIIDRLRQYLPPIRIGVINVDEGLGSYRNKSVDLVRKKSKKMGYELFRVSLKEVIGYSIDEITCRRNDLQMRVCSLCGLLRDYLVSSTALKNDFNKLVLGNTLGDVTAQVLQSLINGKMNPGIIAKRETFPQTIRPLYTVTDDETHLYAIINNLDFAEDKCPYSEESTRNPIRDNLYLLQETMPGILFSIIRGYSTILHDVSFPEEYNTCTSCGRTFAIRTGATAQYCPGCYVLNRLGIDSTYDFSDSSAFNFKTKSTSNSSTTREVEFCRNNEIIAAQDDETIVYADPISGRWTPVDEVDHKILSFCATPKTRKALETLAINEGLNITGLEDFIQKYIELGFLYQRGKS